MDDRDRQFLLDGLKFNQDLGQTLSVDTVCYFGRKKKTTTGGVVSRSPAGKWEKIEWLETEAGDGTVPVHSAVHPQAKERHAFAVDHGSIYFQEDVLVQLEFDLAGGAEGLEFAIVTTNTLTIEMDSDADFYAPGELVRVYCSLHDRTRGANPVTDGAVELSLHWYEALPGDETTPHVFAQRGFDAMISAWDADFTVNPAPLWHSAAIASGYNIVSYLNAAVDSLLEQARTLTDPRAAAPLWHAFQKIIVADCPIRANLIETVAAISVIAIRRKGIATNESNCMANAFAFRPKDRATSIFCGRS